MFLSQAWVCKGWAIKERENERGRKEREWGREEKGRKEGEGRATYLKIQCVVCAFPMSSPNKEHIKSGIMNLDWVVQSIIAPLIGKSCQTPGLI